MKDLISIVVPVYNVEKYMQRNLESLVNQTYENIEILVINDGTPDNSVEIINKYVEKYPKKVYLFNKKNGGLSDARNYGLKRAKGKYIVFIDSDDYVEHNMIEELYLSIKKNKSDISICNIIDEYEDNGKTQVYSNYIPVTPCSIYEDKKQMLNRFAAWNKMFDINLFKKNKLTFDKGFIYEDLRLVLKIYLYANKISYTNKALYHYIIRSGSIMTSANLEKNYNIILAMNNLIEYYQKEKKYKEFKSEIEFLAIDHALIATSVRIIKISKFSELKKNLKSYYDFMEKEFPNYMQNKYINLLNRNKRIILFLLNKKMYKILKLIITISGK